MHLKLQQELLESFYAEALPLMKQHHAEVDEWPDIPFDCDIERYRALFGANGLRIYTARLDSGELIGYVVFIVGPNPHRQSHYEALCDCIYVAPEQRRGRTGIELIRFAERRLKAEGVQAIYHYAKAGHPALAVVLGAQGYAPIETVWGKRFA